MLLYGPPGTGKTLLVRAFAKESGASVLEVSAADINQEACGQSEKTIRAIFSLAKKLMPCVVFIDEADSIFGKRVSGEKSWERSTKTQFLREETDKEGVVLIAATNRPFDMDDASLRRFPRRILLDIPEVEQREAILKLQLRDEVLADDVDFRQIARETVHYTGSDLKNMAYEAALMSIQERRRVAEESTREASRDSPPTGQKQQGAASPRVIHKRHLEIAKNTIRPGVSMDTLKQIREFHARYGNTAKED